VSEPLSQPSQPIFSKEIAEDADRQMETEISRINVKQDVTIEAPIRDCLKPPAVAEVGLSQPPVTNSDLAVVTELQVVMAPQPRSLGPDRIPCLVNGETGWSRKAGPMPRLSVFVCHADGRQLSAGPDQVTDLLPAC
jgi:hypothetical protein